MGNSQILFFGAPDTLPNADTRAAFKEQRAVFDAACALVGTAEEGRLHARVKAALAPHWTAENAELVNFITLAALRFRKHVVDEAVARSTTYLQWRTNTFGSLAPQDAGPGSTLRAFLDLGVIRLLPRTSPQGHALLHMRFARTRPDLFDAAQVAACVHFVFMKALRRSPLTQINGFIMLPDLTGSGFNNLDKEVPKRVIKMLSKNLPVRLSGVLINNPNFMLHIVLPIAKMFMPTKLAERIRIMSDGELTTYGLPRDLLPPEIGGTDTTLPDVQTSLYLDGDDGGGGGGAAGENKADEDEEDADEISL